MKTLRGILIDEEDVQGGDGADQPSSSGWEAPDSSGDVGVPDNPPQPENPQNN